MTTTPEYTPEQIAEFTQRRQSMRSWFGYVADENIEHIAERITNLLKDRRYTFVVDNTHYTWSLPEVRTGQRLMPEKSTTKKPVNVHRIGDVTNFGGKDLTRTSCGLGASDTYGFWGLHSSFGTEREASLAAEDEKTVTRTTYVNIDGGSEAHGKGDRDKIEVTHHNGYGHRLHWVIAVEPEPREEY